MSVLAYMFDDMSGQPSPHDAVFRRVLGEPANAGSQLRPVLPAALVMRLDLDRLARVPGSFVDPVGPADAALAQDCRREYHAGG